MGFKVKARNQSDKKGLVKQANGSSKPLVRKVAQMYSTAELQALVEAAPAKFKRRIKAVLFSRGVVV